MTTFMNTTENLPQPFIPFTSPEVTLDQIGGKGLNLAKLVVSGFQVPRGFFIPTSCFHDFLAQNDLTPLIESALHDLDLASPEVLSAASKIIRDKFTEGVVDEYLISSLEVGYHWLGSKPVAVRSSATAEDLPDMSFAGQQDTFLNVIGEKALLMAVVNCWSSLWTARAIGYRARNNIAHGAVSLAVVVQNMVQSDASGVLFTANPLTGLRTETVIDATFGLGEALVSGRVEPDHYVIDQQKSIIPDKFLGSKSTIIKGGPEGGVITQEANHSLEQAISDEIILQLAETGKEIELMFNFPQDIEWAFESQLPGKDEISLGGKIHILQSRPITSLFPIPEGMGPEPLQVLFSFGAVQGILDPWTPLGKDAIRLIFAGGASLLGYDIDHETQGVIKFAGERLWGNLTPVIRHPLGVKIVPKVFPGVEPGSLQAIKEIISDPGMGAGTGRLRFSTFRRIGGFATKILKRVLHFLNKPDGQAERIRQYYEADIARLREKSLQPSDGERSLHHDIDLYREIYDSFVLAIPEIFTGALAGLLPILILNKFSKALTGSGDLALEVTRGLPNNVTTEMDLELWETARCIRRDDESFTHFVDTTAEDLADLFLQKRLPETAQAAIARFLETYGIRGPGEIDIGRPRWREEPTSIMQALQSYLKIEDENMAPDAVFKRGALAAEAAIRDLETAVRQTFGGGIKARLVRAAAHRVRALAGLRESPKFYIIQKMGIIRQKLLIRGSELVVDNILNKPDDLFFLYLNELDELARGETRDWGALISERRKNYYREMRRVQIPRLILSDGRAFYEGMIASETEEGTLIGSPVSPGIVTGTVRVVLAPQNADLAPGEILVCPGTDPAWTPLFLAAGGLIMEVGGLMTHGAIVAREYGIPAVVGVDRATTRLATGQKVLVNGSTGEISLVD
jgi:phosphohistidine swiveling domain-containing protein